MAKKSKQDREARRQLQHSGQTLFAERPNPLRRAIQGAIQHQYLTRALQSSRKA